MPHRAPDRANSRFFFLGAFSETSRPFHPTIVPHLRRPLLSRLAVFCIYRGISQRHSGRARQRAGGRPTGDRDRDTCADAHDGDGRAEARLDSDDRASQEGGLVRSGLREGRLRDWLHCGPQTARDEEHSCGKPHTHSHIPPSCRHRALLLRTTSWARSVAAHRQSPCCRRNHHQSVSALPDQASIALHGLCKLGSLPCLGMQKLQRRQRRLKGWMQVLRARIITWHSHQCLLAPQHLVEHRGLRMNSSWMHAKRATRRLWQRAWRVPTPIHT